MSDIKVLQKYHALLKPYLAIFFVSIVFDIAMTGLGLTTPLLTRVLFDYAYAYRNVSLLNITIAAIIAAYFLYFFLSVASDYLQIYINQEATATLSEKVFSAIARLPLRFHQEKKSGDLIIRMTDDVSNTIGTVLNALPTVIIDGGRFLIILMIALSINVKLTLLALVSVPLYILETRFYAGRRARMEKETIDADSDILSRAQEKLSGIKTIKAFGQERRETLSFATLIRRRCRVAIRCKVLEVAQTFTNSITLQTWAVFLMWYLGYQVVLGQLTIGEIVALMLYFEQMGGPIQAFIGLFTEWKRSLVSMRRLDEVLEASQEGDRHAGARDFDLREGDVSTSHLTFAYAPGEEVLHDIDVRFPPRSMTAIVGMSGSGKSTLINLILRFFDPTCGAIVIDDQNISEVYIRQLRNKIGIVTQETTLFDGTIMDNILYGNEGRSRGDAMAAARLAGAHGFIERLPGGYDAPAGVGGGLLSSGQRQRIAIARTLLRDPSVIILDEATSALDAESEFRIQEVISQLRRTKTVIVVAHRLSTIKTADNILVLEDGRFVEEGGFDELLEKKGAFYRFYWRQFGGLASFRQQLSLELERSARYGSKFCLAVLKLKNFDRIESSEGPSAAERYAEAVDYLIKRQIRMGDNCAILGGGTILVLLPEISARQMKQFFQRMLIGLPRPAGAELPHQLKGDDIFLAGASVSHKLFRTPEGLLSALKDSADRADKRSGFIIIDEKELSQNTGGKK